MGNLCGRTEFERKKADEKKAEKIMGKIRNAYNAGEKHYDVKAIHNKRVREELYKKINKSGIRKNSSSAMVVFNSK